MSQFVEINEVNHTSPTCQTKLRTRERMTNFKNSFGNRPFFSSVKQSQHMKNMDKIYYSAT